MYYVSRVCIMDDDILFLVNTNTLREEKVSKDRLIDIIEDGLLIPNDGKSIRYTDMEGNESIILMLGGSDIVYSNVDAVTDVDFSFKSFMGKEHIQYSIDVTSSSWRRNRMMSYGNGVTIVGNGKETYVHYKGKIGVIEGIKVIFGIFFDDLDILTFRGYSDFGEKEEQMCWIDDYGEVQFNRKFRVKDGSATEMKRLALFQGV